MKRANDREHRTPSGPGHGGVTFASPAAIGVALVLTSLLLAAEARALGDLEIERPDAPPAAGRQRWVRLERGSGEKEQLWAQEGGAVEYVRYAGGRIVEHRVGLMPPKRFGQLCRQIDQPGPLEAIFRLGAGLRPSDRYGTFVRLGAPVSSRPTGLDAPAPSPAAGSPPVGPEGPSIIEDLLTHPGRFLFVRRDVDRRALDGLPTDPQGTGWIQQEDRWLPVLVYLHQPPD
ncbi:MAG: hypothetical protein HY613_02800 [Candidatus Rokubacteria bacterium]|nr:hypothetical protein [Candidatus Rokubacteria bacterium]